MKLVFTYTGAALAFLSLSFLAAVIVGFKPNRDTNFNGERNVLLAAGVLALIAIALAVLSLGGTR